MILARDLPAHPDGLNHSVALEGVLVKRAAKLSLLGREGANDPVNISRTCVGVDGRYLLRAGRLRRRHGVKEKECSQRERVNKYSSHKVLFPVAMNRCLKMIPAHSPGIIPPSIKSVRCPVVASCCPSTGHRPLS